MTFIRTREGGVSHHHTDRGAIDSGAYRDRWGAETEMGEHER
jgi:hypothetical protein